MKIETTFDLGQWVYYLERGSIMHAKIEGIELNRRCQSEAYKLDTGITLLCERIFASAEECYQNVIDYYQRLLEEEINKKDE